MASVTADAPASPLGDENQQHPLSRLSRVITASATAKTANYTEDRYREVVFECRCINDEGGSEEHGTDIDDRGCRGCDDAGGNVFSHDKFLKRYEEGEEDEASGEVEEGTRRRRG